MTAIQRDCDCIGGCFALGVILACFIRDIMVYFSRICSILPLREHVCYFNVIKGMFTDMACDLLLQEKIIYTSITSSIKRSYNKDLVILSSFSFIIL